MKKSETINFDKSMLVDPDMERRIRETVDVLNDLVDEMSNITSDQVIESYNRLFMNCGLGKEKTEEKEVK